MATHRSARRRKAETARSRRWAILGLGACLPLVLFAGSAIGAKLKTESANTTVPVGVVGAATATCEQGQKVVSGGFESVDFDPEFILAGHLPYASFRPNGRSWTAAAEGFGSQTGTLIAYAYCWQEKRLKARTASATIPADGDATATARCKQDEKVIAGGYDVPDFDPEDSGPFAYTSRKQGKRAWTASTDNYDDVPATLVAQAYCREGKGVKTKSRSDSVGFAPETGDVTAKCKRGQRVLSGGFDNPDYASGGGGAQLLPFVSRKQGARRWTVSAYNEGSEVGTLTVYAYCEKKT